jgi:uncharacterized membrane protein HdeD (DUF308 family)
MSRGNVNTPALLNDFEHIRQRWGWFLGLGIVLIVLGTTSLFYVYSSSLAAIAVLGWLMLLSGVVEGVYGFHARRWEGAFLQALGCVFGILVGLLVLTHPLAGALAWTLLFAAFFTVIGLYRIIAASYLRFRRWGWVVADGVVTVVLGLLLWVNWPSSGTWFLGFALGIALIVRGWTNVVLALALAQVAPSDARATTS